MDRERAKDSSDTDKAFETQQYPTVKDRVFCGSDQPILHHVCLFVPDLEASVAFYTSGLGLTLRETFDDIIGLRASGNFPFKIASIFLQAGDGRYIELHPAGEGVMSPPGFPLNHLAFAVVDVDAAYDQALAAGGTSFGFTIHEEHWDGTPLDVIMSGNRSEPMRMAFLQGPSGELIELYQASVTDNSPFKTGLQRSGNA